VSECSSASLRKDSENHWVAILGCLVQSDQPKCAWFTSSMSMTTAPPSASSDCLDLALLERTEQEISNLAIPSQLSLAIKVWIYSHNMDSLLKRTANLRSAPTFQRMLPFSYVNATARQVPRCHRSLKGGIRTLCLLSSSIEKVSCGTNPASLSFVF